MRKKIKVAIVRGKFLNKYEMQVFEKLSNKYDFTAFGSLNPFHDILEFPVKKLLCPMDIPEFPYKMQILNRLFIDAHYLVTLESRLAGFDIAHSAETYFHYTQQCLVAKKKGYIKKVVITVLENIPFNNETILGRKRFKKKAREEVDHFIAISSTSKQSLILEGVESKKISIIGSSINTVAFSPVKKDWNPLEIRILYVGRMEEYKGVYEVIYSFKKLLQDPILQKYRLRLRFIGEGCAKKDIIKVGEKLKMSKYITHASVSYDDIVKEYRKADIFVAPSKPTSTWQEQFGYTLLEAQACGLPIVTAYSGVIPENVGNAAMLVSPGDYFMLADSIKKLILNPKLRYEYSKKARKRAVEVHDTKHAAKKIANVYETIL